MCSAAVIQLPLTQIILSRYSGRLLNNLSKVFCAMFLDSTIAKSLCLSRTKTTYFATHGIAPQSQHLLLEQLRKLRIFEENWGKFPLRISSLNVTKFAVSCGFGHIYWKNPWCKNSFFVQCEFKRIRDQSFLNESNDIDPYNLNVVQEHLWVAASVHSRLKSAFEKNWWKVREGFWGAFQFLHDTSAWREDYVFLIGWKQLSFFFCVTQYSMDMLKLKLIVS